MSNYEHGYYCKHYDMKILIKEVKIGWLSILVPANEKLIFVSSIYPDKRDDFSFDIVNFHFLDGVFLFWRLQKSRSGSSVLVL